MATTNSSDVQVILTLTQGSANAVAEDSYAIDPFQRNAGFRLKGYDISFDPLGFIDVAADAWIDLQLYAATSAVASALYAAGSNNMIDRFVMASMLTTSGVGIVIPRQSVDFAVPYLIGAEYLGAVVDSTGFTAVTIARVVLRGDAVTLTDAERAASRARFV